MLRRGEARDLRIFTYWLDKDVLGRRGVSAMEFRRMCDRGEIRGFELPGSDTVTGGDSASSLPEQRDGSGTTEAVESQAQSAAPKPGNAGEQPGRHQGDGGDGRRDRQPI